MVTLSQLNAADALQFVTLLESIYEHSPWIPQRAAHARPFDSVASLHLALQKQVEAATQAEQLGLIRAHPELVGRVAPATLTAASRSEQAGAGLNESTALQVEELRELNRAYRERFDFPFVVAVRGLSRDDIVARLKARLANPRDIEFQTCLAEVGKIALFRLNALITT